MLSVEGCTPGVAQKSAQAVEKRRVDLHGSAEEREGACVGYPHPPGILYEYQNRELAGGTVCMIIKRKELRKAWEAESFEMEFATHAMLAQILFNEK